MEQIRIGVIGCGGISHGHVNRLAAMPNVKVTALMDVSEDQIASFKQRIPIVQGCTQFLNYKELLDSGLTDAVLIASPHTCHYEQIMASLEHGQHVLCEKPMVCTMKHAHDVIRKVESTGKVFLLSYQRHFAGGFRYIRRMISEGHIGDVQFITAMQCQDWLRFTKNRWRQVASLSGGGQLNDSGSHLVDIVLWTSGLAVESVSAYCDFFGTEVDINSALTLRFTNGAQGNLSVIGNCPGWWEDLTFVGSKGVIYSRNGKITHVNAQTSEVSELTHVPDAGDPDRNFINAIREGEPVQSPALCGLRVIELTEAAWQSAAKNGTPVRVARTEA